MVFLSGCIPLVPETMKVIEGGIEEQTVRPLFPIRMEAVRGEGLLIADDMLRDETAPGVP